MVCLDSPYLKIVRLFPVFVITISKPLMNPWKHLSKYLWVIVRSKCMFSFNLGKNCQIVLPKKYQFIFPPYMYACPFLIPSLKVLLITVFMGQFARGNHVSVVLWDCPVTGVYFQLLLIQLYFSSELALFQLGCLSYWFAKAYLLTFCYFKCCY